MIFVTMQKMARTASINSKLVFLLLTTVSLSFFSCETPISNPNSNGNPDSTSTTTLSNTSTSVPLLPPLAGLVSTLAGVGQLNDGAGAQATFNGPSGVASDGTYLYVSDTANNTIRRIVISTGIVSTLAGSTQSGFQNGIGLEARFNGPHGLALFGDSLFVADLTNNAIRRISVSTGQVTTFAGNGTPGATDAAGTAATFNGPIGLATDGTATLYVADTHNNQIRSIVIATAAVSTLAGAGIAGWGFLDATGTAAQFKSPQSLTWVNGDIYVADTGNNRIRKIVVSTGVVTTIAGDSEPGTTNNASGTLARFSAPISITSDGSMLYVADIGSHLIRTVEISSTAVGTLAGSGLAGDTNAVGTAASFYEPRGIAIGGDFLFVADSGNNLVRSIFISSGSTSTLAGSGSNNSGGDSDPDRFYNPYALTSDGSTVYVADTNNNVIKKISIATGATLVLAGSGTEGSDDGTGTAARFNRPQGLATDGIYLYVADTGNNMIRRIVISNGVVTTLAGALSPGFVDQAGTLARFNTPTGLALVGGSLYVADSQNNRIRKVELGAPNPAVTTAAGDSSAGTQDGNGTEARFNYPTGIASDGTTLYIADKDNHLIRGLTILTGTVSKLAGDGQYGTLNGTGTNARFGFPAGLATDGQRIYVCDTANNLIRTIQIASREVSTLAGSGAQGAVNGLGNLASFAHPTGVAVSLSDPSKLFVADSDNFLIRKIE